MRRRGTKYSARRRTLRDDGQVTIFVVLAMAIFLLGFVGFAVDMTNLWFHRQMAQGAADAACQAGIMNILVPTATQGFVPGLGFNCSGASSATPCRYAALNGYNGSGLAAGSPSNEVVVSFPGSVAGATPPPTNLAQFPYLRVDITDRAKLTFATLITGRPTSDVHAFAECGVVLAKVPIPIIVLNPTCQHSFQQSGNSQVAIIGGPSKSVQVNSINACASATTNAAGGCSSNGPTIDLRKGGPNFTGSTFGSFGGPTSPPPGFLPGTTGSWSSPATPIQDPYALLPSPSPPGLSPTNAAPIPTLGGTLGCPETPPATCDRYQPGLYDHSIVIKNRTAIFDPGLYYIQPTSYPNSAKANCGSAGSGCASVPGPSGGQCAYDLILDAGSTVRPSVGAPDPMGYGGTMFYLSGPGSGSDPYGSVFISSNSGTQSLPYSTSAVQCPGGPAPDPNIGLPSSLPKGNILLAPCSGPYGGTDGVNRGVLFFQDRSNGYQNGQPSMQGGGGLILAGTMYFHHCPASPSCNPATDYKAFYELQGNGGPNTFVIGNIITDELILGGTTPINMALDPNNVFNVLKATLMR
jgi:hypothetical protein